MDATHLSTRTRARVPRRSPSVCAPYTRERRVARARAALTHTRARAPRNHDDFFSSFILAVDGVFFLFLFNIFFRFGRFVNAFLESARAGALGSCIVFFIRIDFFFW